jgi:hypothetical protein
MTGTQLKDGQDAYGQAMLDHLRGRPAWEIVERDDGHISIGAGPELYFAEFKGWRPVERQAMRFVRGRVGPRIGTFDTILMLGGNLGLLGTPGGSPPDPATAPPRHHGERTDHRSQPGPDQGPESRHASVCSEKPEARAVVGTEPDQDSLPGLRDALVRLLQDHAGRTLRPSGWDRLGNPSAPAIRGRPVCRRDR